MSRRKTRKRKKNQAHFSKKRYVSTCFIECRSDFDEIFKYFFRKSEVQKMKIKFSRNFAECSRRCWKLKIPEISEFRMRNWEPCSARSRKNPKWHVRHKATRNSETLSYEVPRFIMWFLIRFFSRWSSGHELVILVFSAVFNQTRVIRAWFC